ncbi:MFS transporter [Shewanella yunxiaonensis]|uniref:MFS transporter n=1 Tax=Shewanella yunxiaonensis TaxID=2829809 RepID=A0ABX7YX07_9GAMM|nr:MULTISPECIES: MFS transporter [Shewanella]MDF0535431.1 MFS transporter [Shewanella sp. A32]QUN07195.1 MFS transporter [Shewanella yunxiaonensis]
MMNSFLPEGQLRWLSGCYFFFFAILGALIPYLGLFLEHRGFNAAEIGFLMAIFMGTRIIAPNIWAMVADRTGRRSELVKLGSLTAAVGYLSFFYNGGFIYLALSLTFYTFFWNAILAQMEVITLETLGDKSNRYGSIRSYGSVGYIIWVIATGAIVNWFGPEAVLYVGLVLFAGLFFCSMPLTASASTAVRDDKSSPLKLTKPIIWFLLSAMLLQASVGPFYGFFVLYLKQVGYSEALAGIFVAMGAFAEIFMFAIAPKLLGRFSVRTLLMTGMAVTAIRWVLVAFLPEKMPILALSQVMHAFTFGLVHASSIQFVHRHFEKAHRSKGQALYASLSFGVGGALGNWISGHIWGDGSSAWMVWIFAAICAVAAMLVVLALPPEDQNSSDNRKLAVAA